MYRVADAIPLPGPGDPLIARTAREDRYPVFVTSTVEEAMQRLAGLVGTAEVAVITDETVEALYGGVLLRALREIGKEPLVRALPAGEGSKSLRGTGSRPPTSRGGTC
jgi:3-dehydroquinate synthetase